MAYRAVQPAQYISQYDPAMEQRMQDVMVTSQARYDQAFNNILGEQARQGEIFFLNPKDKEIAQSGFKSQVDDILQRYEGDYGAASKELSKAIVAERNNPAYQLSQYQVQKAQEANRLKTQLGPEAIVVQDVAPTLYDETGRLRDASEFDYNIMQRSNYDKMIVDATKGIANSIEQSNLTQSEKDYYLKQVTEKGLARLNSQDKQVLAQLIGNKLQSESTWQYDPAVQGLSPYDYALNSFDRLIASGVQQDYMFDRARLASEKDQTTSDTTPSSVVYAGGLTSNQKAFTSDTFNKVNPNVKNFGEKLFAESLQPVNPSMEKYTSGEVTLDELQASTIEKNLLDEDKELKKLYDIGIKSNDDLAKELGFNSFKDLKDSRVKYERQQSASQGGSGYAELGAAMQIYKDDKGKNIFERFNEKRDERNKAIREYSNNLKIKAADYIKNNNLDSDFDILFYQPDFTQEGVKTEYNNWKENIDEGFTTPDQFKFLDGKLSNSKLSSDDIKKSYSKEGSEDFGIMGVGGNDSTGLIWKVKNPDGTISNATWNTGYEKQYNYVTRILRNPELVEVLNASTLDFTDKGEIKVTMPDVPPKIKNNINKYDLITEPNLEMPTMNYVKIKDGKYLTLIDGNIRTVENKNDALAMPKALIFDILNSLQ